MTPTLVIKNHTAWPTRMLRPFVTRIVREEFPGTLPSNTRTSVCLVIGYNRGKGFAYCSGHARYHSSTATVNVPNPKYGGTFPVLDFCHVVGHEFGHCKGIRHAAMGLHYGHSCARGSYTEGHYEWAKALPVPVVIKKPKPTREAKRLAKLATAEAAVQRWTRKQKLATTKLKQWTRTVRRLQKQVEEFAEAVAAVGPPSLDS